MVRARLKCTWYRSFENLAKIRRGGDEENGWLDLENTLAQLVRVRKSPFGRWYGVVRTEEGAVASLDAGRQGDYFR